MRTASLVVLALCGFARLLPAQVDSLATLRRLYDGSLAAADRSNLPLAAAMADSLLAMDPTNLDAWWNLGLWRAAMNQPTQALAAWRGYLARDSTDWRAEAKLIQAYQSLGNLSARDSALAGLMEHRRRTSNPELREAAAFCREQTMVDGHTVMVFQTFTPEGDRRIFVTFYLLGADGRDTARYSLGSYDRTTATAREAGQIGQDERLYHLDYYRARTHATLQFFRKQPSYDRLREVVWAAIRGEVQPMSRLTAPPP